MIGLLAKLFIPNRTDIASPKVRQAYGMLCGIVGIILNLILFAGKLLVGILSSSIAVTADAFNNLSDAGSSVLTLIGFRIAGQKPDSAHPFGHGRMEYISGLLVAVLILLMGFELGKSSLEKIFRPEPVDFSLLAIVILTASVAVKLYMAFYNRKIAKKIDSAAMKVTAADSLNDCVATEVVLLSMFFEHFTKISIDAYCGLLVALFILKTGIGAIKDTVGPLLGQPPAPELVEQIQQIVLSHPEVQGIHDLIVHDYGPGRVLISLHAEVPADADFLKTHDTIDNIEKDLARILQCQATIHMDPIVTDDDLTSQTRQIVAELVRGIDPDITIHDFRMVIGTTHTNVIFDAVVPYHCLLSDRQVKEEIARMVSGLDGHYFAVVHIDKSHVL